tara:strand:+ start:711 stop:938 length:228 start_codon:yes stop_codon:yes gene_type:complete
MKLSNQAMGAIMMALQKALMEQTDIVPVLQSFEFSKAPETKKWGTSSGELIVKNPPSFKVDNDTLTDDPSLDGED